MKELLYILMFICVAECHGQYIPTLADSKLTIDSYEHYKDILNTEFEILKSKSNDGSYQGIFIAYYWLNAPIDTTWRHLYNFVSKYPIEGCDLITVKTHKKFDASFKTTKNGIILGNRIKPICDSVYLSLDSTLIDILTILGKNDQKYRADDLDRPTISDNKNKWKLQDSLDKYNRDILDAIIKRKGYPHRRIVGQSHEAIAWNIIQHGDATYIEKHLPLVEKVIKEGNLNSIHLPYMIDKLALLKGRPQLYGTQLIYNSAKKKMEIYRIDDLEKVEQRRTNYYLGSLKDYMKHKNLEISQ